MDSMEETNPKKQRGGGGGGSECGCEDVEKLALKKPRTTPSYGGVVAKEQAAADQEREDMMAWLTLDDETVTELSDLLDSSGPGTEQPFNFKVKFIDDPYSSPVIFQSSSAYVTINGNEESCGSSFSDLDSSVMASVDMGSVRGLVRKFSGVLNVGGGGSGAEDEEGARGWLEERDFVEGIFVKSLRGRDLFGTPPPSGYNFENDGNGNGDGGAGGGSGEDEMWINFAGDDLFGGSW